MTQISEVRQHLENWVKNFLSIPHPLLQGFAPCPYSKEAILRNSIDIRWFNGPDLLDVLLELTKTWTDDFEVVFFATDSKNIDVKTMQACLEQANHTLAKYNLFAIDDHPDDPPLEKVNTTNDKYALVFVQRFSKLQEASEHLVKLGYYQSWSKQEFEFVTGSRSRFLHYMLKHETVSSESS